MHMATCKNLPAYRPHKAFTSSVMVPTINIHVMKLCNARRLAVLMEKLRVTCAVRLESVYEVLHNDFVDDIQAETYSI